MVALSMAARRVVAGGLPPEIIGCLYTRLLTFPPPCRGPVGGRGGATSAGTARQPPGARSGAAGGRRPAATSITGQGYGVDDGWVRIILFYFYFFPLQLHYFFPLQLQIALQPAAPRSSAVHANMSTTKELLELYPEGFELCPRFSQYFEEGTNMIKTAVKWCHSPKIHCQIKDMKEQEGLETIQISSVIARDHNSIRMRYISIIEFDCIKLSGMFPLQNEVEDVTHLVSCGLAQHLALTSEKASFWYKAELYSAGYVVFRVSGGAEFWLHYNLFNGPFVSSQAMKEFPILTLDKSFQYAGKSKYCNQACDALNWGEGETALDIVAQPKPSSPDKP